MTTKATEKIIEALTQLVEGFAELQEKLEGDYDPDVETASDDSTTDSDKDEESTAGIGEAMVTEIKAAVESVIENEDCAPEDLASIVSALTDALEEIDPEVFSHGEAEEEEEEDEDEDEEDFDEDYDEEDDDEDEDEEEEEEEEEDEEEEKGKGKGEKD
jgi:hypothetical protein